MINTRILEQRLGWRGNGQESGDDQPESRPIRHESVLQGRVRHAPGRGRGGPRRADIEATWAALPAIAPSTDDMAGDRRRGLAPFDRNGAAAAALDQLRTQLLRVTRENGWRRVGVTAPARGGGCSFVAAGLAASVARLNYIRVLLMDMDLSEPGLARLLRIESGTPISDLLVGAAPVETWMMRVGDNLALGLGGEPVAGAADLVQNPDMILGLRAAIDALSPDLVIHDLPPLLTDPSAQALLPQLDAVLLVADGTRTQARDIIECERCLEGQVPLLGVILNKSEDTGNADRRLSRN
ncbi:MAG: ATPases involved in chromosome partitioning [Rhodobacteraceae bacterium HLUCCA12]|nr:MAG: ATPases involved in chromosome partitioning [Rhodobacteraceae bacterium HLUCCA12]